MDPVHQLSSLLESLHNLGAASWPLLWLPVLAWTSVVLIAVAALRLAPALPPLWTYRFRQTLLAALPLGVIAAAMIDLPARALPPSAFAAPTLISTPLPGVTVAPGAISLTWTHAVGLLTIVAAGTAGFALSKLTVQIVRTRLLGASVRQRQPHACNEPEQLLLEQTMKALRSRLNVRRDAQSVIADAVESPMLLPGRPPLIVLPVWMLDRARTGSEPTSTLDMSIAHELVHLNRYDDWAAIIEQVVASLAAIHPLVHLLMRDIQLSRETACDAAVLSALRCRRGSYARLLADVATRQHTVPVVALSESTSSLEERLHAMTYPNLNETSTFLRVASVSVFALLIVGMVACADNPSGSAAADETESVESAADAKQDIVVFGPDDLKSGDNEYPQIKGGMQALSNEISYPESARQNGDQGRVMVQFVVSKEGVAQDVEVIKGVSAEIDAEALRAVKQLSFDPGTKDGEAVNARMTLPITFKLPDNG